jgi:DNA (cytosine-5)-methyltransferase 1
MTALSGELFAGTGMLGRAVGEVFGTRPAWFCEFDAAPSKVLAHHYPDVPNYGDVTKVDFTTVPHTHVRAGGFPCQDVSVSGARAGLRDGTRSGLWSEFARSIAEDRPDWVVIENVGGLLSAEAHSDVEPCPWCLGEEPGEPALRALGAVLADLAALGFDAEWTSIRASDVGAPHGRLRVFILGWPAERTRSADADSARRGSFRGINPIGRDAHGRSGEDGPRAGSESAASAANTHDRPGDRERARSVSRSGSAEAGLTLLPTPSASPFEGEPEPFLARQARLKELGVNGNGAGTPLAIAVRMLPTPTVGNATGGNAQRGGDRSGEKLLPGIAVELAESGRLLPTPRASDSDGGVWERSGTGNDLRTEVSLLPTPRASRGGSATETMYGLGAERDDDDDRQGNVTGEVSSWGPYAAAIERWEQVMGRLAPSPVRMDGKGGKARLNPELTEWMMGWPLGWVTASVIGLSRAEQLKACGNGVVLQQAITALRMLLTRPGVPAVEWEMAA